MASEIVERSRSHFLSHDDDGWALWGVDQDTDEPLLTFDADDAGEERARWAFEIRTKETQRVRWLVVAAVTTGLAWVMATVLAIVYERLVVRRSLFLDAPASYRSLEVQLWLQAADGITYALFTVTVGLFLVAWLQRRWRREG